MPLPPFKYHPDPVKTGSIQSSDALCKCCGLSRGFVYTGAMFGPHDDLPRSLCPWCIADGSAHQKFDVQFTLVRNVGNYGDRQPVPEKVVEEVAYRTPGFTGWQEESWMTHCGDAAEFLGPASHADMVDYGEPLIQKLKKQARFRTEGQWEEFFMSLDGRNGCMVWVFRCRKCGELDCYLDFG
jgi:uncharacterized protein CbrC (UPF0167 family)